MSNIYLKKRRGDPVPYVEIDDDLGEILNSAVRYALGRTTYVSYDTPNFIRPLLPYLSNRTICVMERDIRERGEDPWYKDTGRPYGDPDIDEPSWLAFLKEIQNEIKARKERGEYS